MDKKQLELIKKNYEAITNGTMSSAELQDCAFQLGQTLDHIKALQKEVDRHKWRVVEGGNMPDYDVPVFVKNVTDWPDAVWAAVLVYEDGWLWAAHQFGDLRDPTNYEVDDDDQYTHWMPLPTGEGLKEDVG